MPEGWDTYEQVLLLAIQIHGKWNRRIDGPERKEIVNAVVFDGEGCSIDVFRAFDRLNRGRRKKIYQVTVLDSNQYRCVDFKMLKNRLTTTSGGLIACKRSWEV